MDAIYGHRPASLGREGGIDAATSLLESMMEPAEYDHTEEEFDFLYGDRLHYADVENSKNLLDAFYSYADVEDILRDEDVHIPLFPTVVESSKDSINYAYDIDGIVIELREITALKASLHYLDGGQGCRC
ncbi:unnamed protein product [Leuciscus chuanchicus]